MGWLVCGLLAGARPALPGSKLQWCVWFDGAVLGVSGEAVSLTATRLRLAELIHSYWTAHARPPTQISQTALAVGARYWLNDTVHVMATVRNLTNETYYTGSINSTTVNVGNPRSFTVELRTGF